MSLNVRPMRYEDLDRVCRMEEENFSMPWKREDFEKLIEDAGSRYFVAEIDGYVIGAAGYSDMVGDGYINNVVIDKEYRGRGYSKKMLEAVTKSGMEAGIYDFTLEVRVSNLPAIRLYEAVGFENAGVRKGFYDHPKEDAYVYWLRIPRRDLC